MLNARYLASISDELVKLYADLEAEIKNDMCKRIAKVGRNSDSIQWSADILAQTGALRTDIDKYITRYNKEAQKLITKIFNEAMNKATTSDIKYYSAGRRELDISQLQIMETSLERFKNASVINKTFAGRKAFSADSTFQSLERMTLTVADSTQKEFLLECNKAYMKVSSGAYSYNEAIASAVNSLASQDIKTIYYTGSGKRREYSIESATRMNVLTGINQTASQQTLQNCDELGTDLVEVSAHLGARPGHEEFQGKVYCLNGSRTYIDSEGNEKEAPNFYEVCRLGEADGICGINCRHSYYPYFEGTPLQYSKEELDELKEKKVSLDGKEVSQYEAEQEQRFTERQIRHWKSVVSGFEYAGIEETPEVINKYNEAKYKLGKWQQRARDISSETGLKRDYTREYIGTKNGIQPRGKTVKENSYPSVTSKAKEVKETINSKMEEFVKVKINNFYSQFTATKSERESTETLISYINSKSKADNTIKEIFNNLNVNGRLNRAEFKISHASGHSVESGLNSIKLTINKLTKSDINNIGKIQTNLHELGHFSEKLIKDSFISFDSSYMKLADKIKASRIYSPGEISKEIFNLIGNFHKEYKIIVDNFRNESNALFKELNNSYKKGTIGYTQYNKAWNKLKRDRNELWSNIIRNKAQGIDALEDIIDALSDGSFMNNGTVKFGHGYSYFASNIHAQASEIYANYTALSITRPDLIKMLEAWKPELIKACRENAEYILKELKEGKKW